MAPKPHAEPIDILLVEDNPGDILLVKKAFEKAHLKNNLHVARSGAEAVDFLFRRGEHADRDEIDLILLDLQLGDRSGLDVLEEVKEDDDLKRTPVVVLTSSEAEEDIISSYDRYANAYITKPVDFAGLLDIVQEIDDFWLSLVRFAPHPESP